MFGDSLYDLIRLLNNFEDIEIKNYKKEIRNLACAKYYFKVLKCYKNNNLRPPLWVSNNYDNILQKYSDSVRIYYANMTLNDALELSIMREPVNIGMNRNMYDISRLDRTFGYRTGAYNRLINRNKKIPLLAVACRTPIRFNKKEKSVNVINLIGFAFDSVKQPDYIYFKKDVPNLRKSRNEGKLINCYSTVFEFALQEAKVLNKTLVFVAIGAGAFRELLPEYKSEDDYKKYILIPALIKASKKIDYEKWEIPKAGTYVVPDCFFDEQNIYGKNTDNYLFINAWDPFSMLGNGNSMDNSLDGYWGRSSAIALLGWPLSNKNIKYVKINSIQ